MDELGPPASEVREVRERQKTMTPQDVRVLAPQSAPDDSPNSSPYPTHHREITPRPLLPMSLNLSLPQARNSSSSLLEAVVGPSSTPPRPSLPTPHLAQPSGVTHPPALQPGPARPGPPPSAFHHSAPSGSGSMASSLRSTSESSAERVDRPETSGSEWDIVSRSSARAGSGEDEAAVKELQRKVDRRRSQLAPLENELAELEARIKAAEARLALAGQGAQGLEGTTTVCGGAHRDD